MFLDYPWLLAMMLTETLGAGLPETVALAAVAVIGYLFGQRTRKNTFAALDGERQSELERASRIARQLETIARALRQDLAGHHSQLTRFKRRLGEAQAKGDEQAWQLLCAEAELILTPTMQLAQQLSLAYDSIRQQSDALETFTQARTDPHTGVGNGRAFEEKLDVLLTSARRRGAAFSVALVSLDRIASPETNEADARSSKTRLPELARLIQSCMRDADFVARYGDEEFVVLMSQTKLAGACIFGERLRTMVIERMGATVSCGLAEFQEHDNARSLLARADSAFYSAKAAGGNRPFVHSGGQIREHRVAGASRSVETGTAAPQAGPDRLTLPISVLESSPVQHSLADA